MCVCVCWSWGGRRGSGGQERGDGGDGRTVVVVLADKDDGKVPETGNVQSLVLLALIGGTVAVPDRVGR